MESTLEKREGSCYMGNICTTGNAQILQQGAHGDGFADGCFRCKEFAKVLSSWVDGELQLRGIVGKLFCRHVFL